MDLEHKIFLFILTSCRILGMFVIAPGGSSTRIPLIVKAATAVSLTVLLWEPDRRTDGKILDLTIVFFSMVASEFVVGFAIGSTYRLSMAAVEYWSAIAANYIGLNGINSGSESDGGSATLLNRPGFAGGFNS